MIQRDGLLHWTEMDCSLSSGRNQCEFKNINPKKVDVNTTNSMPVQLLTKGYVDARHLAECRNHPLLEDKNPKVTSYTKITRDLE